MNYLNVYQRLIEKAKIENRRKNKGIYYEKHHIIPKCIGGSDRKTNLVLLTAKEHYVAHRLLCKIYPKSEGLRYSFWIMMNRSSPNQKRYVTSSRIYEYEKLLFIEMKKRNHYKNKNLYSKNSIQKSADTRKGSVKRPDLSKQNKETVTCPHCGKKGGKNSMMLWHFDKCSSLTGIPRKLSEIECRFCGLKGQAAFIKSIHMKECIDNPDRIPYYAASRFGGRPVNQYDLSGKLLNEFICIAQAVNSGNFSGSGIINCAKGKYKTHKGFIWKYA